MKQAIYCISGLGADHHIFKNLELNSSELKHISWLMPHSNEKIEHYARRMIGQIHHPLPVIIGVSFGGMMGIEIAKQIPLHKLIIISSIKNRKELPAWMRVAGQLELHKILPVKSNKITRKLDDERMGVSNEEERQMVESYRNSADAAYQMWAVDKVLKWKNNWHPHHLVHIHGDSDKVFPIKNLQPDYIIKNGTHLMIYNRAGEISRIIGTILK